MDACPICRARLNGATTCRRCRADLQKAQEVEQRGQALAVAAVQVLVAGDAAGAAEWIDRAYAVHASPTVRTLRALVDATLSSEENSR